MTGVAVITESCLDSNARTCVEVCPVHCIYQLDAGTGTLYAEAIVGEGPVERHQANPDAVALFGDAILYVNPDECTACGACCQPGICPSGAIYHEDQLPDGHQRTRYNPSDRHQGHDHTYFATLSRLVFVEQTSDGRR